MTPDKAPRRWTISSYTHDDDYWESVDGPMANGEEEVVEASAYDAIEAELKIQDEANEILTRQLEETKAERDELKSQLENHNAVFNFASAGVDQLKARLENQAFSISEQTKELQRERRKVQKLREQRNGWIEKWALVECGEYPFTPMTARRYSKDDDAELEAIDSEGE